VAVRDSDAFSALKMASEMETHRSSSLADVTPVPHDQKLVQTFVECNPYEALSVLIIGSNAFLIILETDMRATGEDEPGWVTAVNWCLLFYYMIDVILRMYAYRRKFFYCRWNNLDFVLVLSDIFFKILAAIWGDAPSFGLLRLCKMFRMMRFGRFVAAFKELHMMLSGFVSAMKALMWASLMLTLMLTFWSILAVELLNPINTRIADRGHYEGCDRCPRAFSSVFHANLTFLQQIIAGDSWGQVSVPIIEEEPLTAVFFLALILTINFGLLNLVLTVIVDSAQAARDADTKSKLTDKAKDFEAAKRKLLRVCAELDADGSGELTYAELMDGMDTHPDFSATMALLDITKDDMHVVFDMLDQDNSGSVTFVEFVEQLHKMKSQDDHTMLIFIRGYVNEVRKKLGEQLEFMNNETFGMLQNSSNTCRELKAILESFLGCSCLDILGRAPEAVPLTVSFVGTKGLQQNGLKTAGDGTHVHSFCVCEIEGKPRSKVTTPTSASSKDPTWNFEGTLDGFEPGDTLLFTVWDGTHHKHEMLGQACIPAEELMKNPSGFDGKVPLQRAGQTFASLEVKVWDEAGALQQRPKAAKDISPPISMKSISEDIKMLFSRIDSEFSQPRAWNPSDPTQAKIATSSSLPPPGPLWPPQAQPRGMSHSTSGNRVGGQEMESPCPGCKVSSVNKSAAQIRPVPRVQPRPP